MNIPSDSQHVRIPRSLLASTLALGALLALAQPSQAGSVAVAVEPGTVQVARSPSARNDPPLIVKKATDGLIRSLRENKDAIMRNFSTVYDIVDEHTSSHIDYAWIAKRVLGKHWRRADPGQRARFEVALRTVLVRTYVSALTNFSFGDIRYLQSAVSDDRRIVTVRTEVPQTHGSVVSVDYVMRRRSGPWQVCDVLIEGISLVAAYRAEYSQAIRRDGLESFIRAFAADNERQSAG